MSKSDKAILGALAMDLKRAAVGYNRGSKNMAETFFNEALKRKEELNPKNLKPYLANFLSRIEKLKSEKPDKAADDALLYSTIFQNASQV